MGSLMYAQMGISAIGGLTDFAVAREQAKIDAAVQRYNNTISAINAAQAENTITLSEIQAADASQRQSLEIQEQLIRAEGAAQVSAGAAGVAGGSVENVMRGLRSSASRAQYARKEQTRMQMEAFGRERTQVAVARVTNKDISITSKPNVGAALMGIGTDMLKIWDKHNTPGETLRARLGGTTGSTIGG